MCVRETFMHGKLITFDADNDDVQFPCIMLVSLLLEHVRAGAG